MVSTLEAVNASSSGIPSPFELLPLRQSLMVTALSQVNVWSVLFTVLALAVVYDQVRYWQLKAGIEGPAWKIPFMGPFLESINPKFDGYVAKWLSGPLSCVSVFHKFVIIASERDISRQIFNSPSYVEPHLVDVAKKILRPDNWVFKSGQDHINYRRGLNGLFTRQALASYLPGQQEVMEVYFKEFAEISERLRREQSGLGKDKASREMVYPFRELMCATSCRAFVGHYMSHSQVKTIADDFYLMTAAMDLVNFPVILPYTRTWYGKKAADRVVDAFAACAAKAKIRMKQPGAKPECIADRWVELMMEGEKYRQRLARGENVPAEEKPKHVLRQFSDHEISLTIMSFLFASQDAQSSACSYLTQCVVDHPEALAKVRAEGKRIMGERLGKYGQVTMEDIEKMPYTMACVKETLRFRPPVIMVPHIVAKDYQVTPTYTAKKGSMIIPSTWLALHDAEAYPQPDIWDPERYYSGNADAQTKNYLVWGHGPHLCIGQTYAMNNLALLLHLMTANYDVSHTRTPQSDEIRVFATLFPMDNLILSFTERNPQA